MNIRKTLSGILAIAILSMFIACEKTDTNPEEGYGILPSSFKVDIPNSLSNANLKNANLKSTEDDTLSGDEIYQQLNFFIAVGENAADLVEGIMYAIKYHKIESVIELSYTSDDDNRDKNLKVEADVEFQEKNWEYMLTITDVGSMSNRDEGKAMQVFWNNNPIEGIAILKPININRDENLELGEAIFKIEYSAKGNDSYEEYMMVEIADLPLPDASKEPFGLETMKMFVGKNGPIVDVWGNSNHPNAQFNYGDDEAIGFNWAFVASGDKDSDLAVAELGLPSSKSDASSRGVLLVDNSIKKVLSREITNALSLEYPNIAPSIIEAYIQPYLKNTEAPGFFNKDGFMNAGTAPSDKHKSLMENINTLTPFVPIQVSNLTIEFKR